MRNHGIRTSLLVLAALALFGAGCLPLRASYGTPIRFSLNETKTLSDGLTLTLERIDDSRCKPGVQCIWAGELAATFRLSSDGAARELRLGQIRAPSAQALGRTFTLGMIDTGSATITVTK